MVADGQKHEFRHQTLITVMHIVFYICKWVALKIGISEIHHQGLPKFQPVQSLTVLFKHVTVYHLVSGDDRSHYEIINSVFQ